MTDWSKPGLTDAYASVLTELMGRDTDVATQFVGSASTNIPNGAIRWNPTNYQWETYSASGGTWSAWSTQLSVGALVLGANAAVNTMQAIPISQADARYQAAGSYAALGGNGSQIFLVANSAAATQQAVPRAQADTLYAPISLTGVAMLGNAQTWAKSQSATVQSLGNLSGTITPDLTIGNDLSVTLTGNATLANPSALTPGTSGHISITQDATGGRTLAFGSYWKFGSNGTPTLSTAASAQDVLVYWVQDATHIVASIVRAVQ